MQTNVPDSEPVELAASFRSVGSLDDIGQAAKDFRVAPRSVALGVDGPHSYGYSIMALRAKGGTPLSFADLDARYRADLDNQKRQVSALVENFGKAPGTQDAVAAAGAYDDYAAAEQQFASRGLPVIGFVGTAMYGDAKAMRKAHPEWLVHAGSAACPVKPLPPEAAVRDRGDAPPPTGGTPSAPQPSPSPISERPPA